MCCDGGSHGGFLTGWLIGHPDYAGMWAAASLRNAVLDMSYMITASEIPDWIYACSMNRAFDHFSSCGFETYSVEDNKHFFERSPISQIQNVKTPALFLIGDNDLRVPPHQSYFYYNALKSKGVPTRLLNYPGDGHAIAKRAEHRNDFNL